MIEESMVLDINGEMTYTYVLQPHFDSGVSIPTINDKITCAGYEFKVCKISQNVNSDGIEKIEVECEHISYELAKMQYIKPEYRKPPNKIWKVDEKIIATGGHGSGFLAFVRAVSSKNIPSLNIVFGGSGYQKDDVITITGEESGATSKFRVTAVSSGMIVAIEQPSAADKPLPTPSGQNNWVLGRVYPQIWTIQKDAKSSGGGHGYAAKCVKKVGDDVVFANWKYGIGYRPGDRIKFGEGGSNPCYADVVVSQTGRHIYNNDGSTHNTSDHPNWDPGDPVINPVYFFSRVYAVSGWSLNAKSPEEEEEILAEARSSKKDGDDKYTSDFEESDVAIKGTIREIFEKILEDTGWIFEGTPSTNADTTLYFTSSETSIRGIILEFISYLQDNKICNDVFVFTNNSVKCINEGSIFSGNISYNEDCSSFSSSCSSKKNLSTGEFEYTTELSLHPNINKINELGWALGSTINITPNFIIHTESWDDPEEPSTPYAITPYKNLATIVRISGSPTLKESYELTVSNAYAFRGFPMNGGGSNFITPKNNDGNLLYSFVDNNLEEKAVNEGGGGLPAQSPDDAGKQYEVAPDGSTRLTSSIDSYTPFISEEGLFNKVNVGYLTAGKVEINYGLINEINSVISKFVSPIKLPNNEETYSWLVLDPQSITSITAGQEGPAYTTNLPTGFILGYGGSGYAVDQEVVVTGLESGATSTVKIETIANGMICRYTTSAIPPADPQTAPTPFILFEHVLTTAGGGFMGIVRAVDENNPVISLVTGGIGYVKDQIIDIYGASSGAQAELKILAIRNGVATSIVQENHDLSSWKAGETGIDYGAPSSGNAISFGGLKVFASPFILPSTSSPQSRHMIKMTFPIASGLIVDPTKPESSANPQATKRLLQIEQNNRVGGGSGYITDVDNEAWKFDFAGVKKINQDPNDINSNNDQNRFLGILKKPKIDAVQGLIPGLIGFTEGYHLSDHMLKQSEIDLLADNTIVFVYDTETIVTPAPE